MKKRTVALVLGALIAGLVPLSFGLTRESTDPGMTALQAAKPAQTARSDDEIVAEILSRKGKTYRIDVTQAGESFDVNPRDLILKDKAQFYPHGLIHVYFGSLKLTSKETPMRFADWVLEWVDTEAKPGEKGYELKYDSLEGDLYKGVTLMTSGFSMTAKAVKIKESADTVEISVVD